VQFCVTFAEVRKLELEFEGKTSLGHLIGFGKLIVGDRCREGSLITLNGKDGQYHMFVGREGLGTRTGAAVGQSGPTRQQIFVLTLSSLCLGTLGH